MRNEFRIADIALAPEGHRRMEWAWEYMPVLKLIAEKEAANQPLAGVVVGTCLHLEAKTACLLKVLSSARPSSRRAATRSRRRTRYAPRSSRRASTYSAAAA